MQAMANATALLTVPASAAPYHPATYAQRMMPESPALLALFHSHGSHHERQAPTLNMNLRRKACLRKISAYSGGFRVSDDAEESSGADLTRYAKKRLSFADQHGGQLALEREFNARDAPIYCNSAVTYSLPMPPSSYHGDRWRAGSGSLMQRLLRGVLGAGGRGGEEQKSGWASQPELLSVCLVSCSVLGYVALGYARQGSAGK